MGGRNTVRSVRVTSSGNMPAVCSNSVRRRWVSLQPKRLAISGRYHTGSMAALVTTTSPDSRRIAPSGFRRPAAIALVQLGQPDVRLGDRDGGLDVVALGEVRARTPR